MSRVMTFSRVYPSYHPKAGQPTYFIEKIWNSICWDSAVLPQEFPIPYHIGVDFRNTLDKKHHTIRAGHSWKVGDWFRPVVWGNDVNPKSGRRGPYHSKQITFAPDIQVKKVWNFSIGLAAIYVDQQRWIDKAFVGKVAANDGLEMQDFLDWFKYPKPFSGQIICWNESIEY